MLDPFAGGGSIPLEGQRLGLRAFASDLNPVAVLINKALIELPSSFSDICHLSIQYGREEARREKAACNLERSEGLSRGR